MSVVVPVVVNYSKNFKKRVLLKIPSDINAHEESRKQFISSACNKLREINYQQRIGRSREAGLADAASVVKSAKRGKTAQFNRLRNRFAGLNRLTPQAGLDIPISISDPGSGLGYDVPDYSSRSLFGSRTRARPFESRLVLRDPSHIFAGKRSMDDSDLPFVSQPSWKTSKGSRAAVDQVTYF